MVSGKSVMREVYMAVENDLWALAAMGIRSALENIMKEKMGDQPNLKSLIDAFQGAGYLSIRQILLRHRIGVAPAVLRGALQQGHRARVVARATIRCRRTVAIEFATCRSGRTGGASGWMILGNARRREFTGLAGS